MPLIEITMFEGRTISQKRALVERVTDVVAETINTKRDCVTILIHDIKKEDWGTAGFLRSDRQSFTLNL